MAKVHRTRSSRNPELKGSWWSIAIILLFKWQKV